MVGNTVIQASSPSLNYLGSILENWRQNQVRTLADIEKLDKKRTEKAPVSKASTPKNKAFTSMYSHNWDLDELEKRANDYMEHSLSGGK